MKDQPAFPPNGVPVIGIYARCVRFKHYKPSSEQAKRGIKGRWQEWNGHGWTNCDETNSWESAALEDGE